MSRLYELQIWMFLRYVAPSRPFAVYSPYKEPLLEAYMAVKEAGTAVNCCLSETWLRYHQVWTDLALLLSCSLAFAQFV